MSVQKDQRKLREIRKLATSIVTPELRDGAEQLVDSAKSLEDDSARLLRERLAGSR